MAGDANQGVVSVLGYGAKGDNATNDTAAIQAAISDGNKTGAAVFFPAAVYRVSQLVLMKGTILQGSQPELSISETRTHLRSGDR